MLIWPRHAAAQADSPPSPVLGLSINHSRDTTAFRSMPLLVRLSVIHPDDEAETNVVPIILAPDPGPWSNAVSFQLSGSTGPLPLWPLVPTTAAAPMATVDATNYVQHSFWLPPNQTASMATGTYVLKASLAITNTLVRGSWTGEVSSLKVTLRLIDEPPALTEEEAFTRMSWLSEYERSFGQSQAALGRVEAFLMDYPTNIGALWMKALFLEQSGETTNALKTILAAEKLFPLQNPNAGEPPSYLIQTRRRLQKRLWQPTFAGASADQGLLTFRWRTFSGLMLDLESSSDLVSWDPLLSGLMPQGTNFVWTTNATRGAEFFRLRVR